MNTLCRLGYPALAAALVLGGCATSKVPPVVKDNPRLPDPPAPVSSDASAAPGWVRVGRYSAVRPGPTEAQRDPLQAMVHMKFPRQVRTVGQAVKHTLRRSGYRLDANVGPLHDREVPQVHRDLGPMTLEQALQTLAGPAYRAHPDHGHRTIAFRSSPTPAEPAPPSPAPAGPAWPDSAVAFAASRVQEQAPSEARSSIWALTAAASKGQEQVPSEARRYGPVRSGEILRPIAVRLSPGTGLNTEQLMLALLRANPGAFGTVRGEPNINVLRCRAVLRVPDAQSAPSYGPEAASREVRRQARQWRRNPARGGACVA